MGAIRQPKPVKLIVSILAGDPALLDEAEALLRDAFGPVDYRSDLLPFDHTTYYEPEMGPGLKRRIVAFQRLVDPGDLAAIKRQTNAMEERWAVGGKRRVNLDPGYVSLAKLVLATTKNHGHRIYLGQGIYAEVTLQYRSGRFQPWPWTYPDYASEVYCRMFGEIRARYLEQLRALGALSGDV
ncbi:MAG: DUF4416 family protein [Anaerolineae bacterium]|nr:DUF4416 family protein [Anaerolineae bacterium]